jgi:hypothetical protein
MEWLRYQLHSNFSRWYQERFNHGGSRLRLIKIVPLRHSGECLNGSPVTVSKGARTSTLGSHKGHRFYRWGAFRNRFLEARTEHIQYEVPALIGSARIEAGGVALKQTAQ